MSIPQDVIEDIRDRSDIVELISSYIPLKRAGRNFKTNCPFHNEKTPSFVISPDKQIFHCFGCGKGGGVIQFVMMYERVTFPEAMEILAKRLGVELPRRKSSPKDSLKLSILDANKLAASFYNSQLMLPNSKNVQEYLKQRGLTLETVKQFSLGYALPQRRSLVDFLRTKKVELAAMQEGRLVYSAKDNSLVDMFRNRVMFPIADVRGRIVGFGSRRLNDESDVPKYINTPETVAYHKGSHLFGLFHSKDQIVREDSCVVVEGNMDMIVPFQEGIKNIVASLGTALTAEQIRLLRRYTKNVVLMYDADKAGKKSALRVIDILIEEGMNVRVAQLPEGTDPDTFVREHGAAALKSIVDEASDFFNFKFDFLCEELDKAHPQGKNAIAREMFETIRRFGSLVVRNEYLRKLAEALEIQEEIIRGEFSKVSRGQQRQVFVSSGEKEIKSKKLPFHERYLIQCMLKDKRVLQGLREIFSPDEFTDELSVEIVKKCFSIFDTKDSCSEVDIMDGASESIVKIVTELSLDECNIDQQCLSESIAKLKGREKEIRFNYIKKIIEKAQKSGEMIDPELMLEFVELKKELVNIVKGENC